MHPFLNPNLRFLYEQLGATVGQLQLFQNKMTNTRQMPGENIGTLGIDRAISWIMSLRICIQEKSSAFDKIERVQIDAIKFERTEIIFFSDVFTSAVVIVAQAP